MITAALLYSNCSFYSDLEVSYNKFMQKLSACFHFRIPELMMMVIVVEIIASINNVAGTFCFSRIVQCNHYEEESLKLHDKINCCACVTVKYLFFVTYY